MSNWKHAFGWSGHILVSNDYDNSNIDDNVVDIFSPVFNRIVKDYKEDNLDERIDARQLGVESAGEIRFLAVGNGFSEGFTNYGTIFNEAEVRTSCGPVLIDHDEEYLKAMKEIYNIDLPPCHLMIGCSSEH